MISSLYNTGHKKDAILFQQETRVLGFMDVAREGSMPLETARQLCRSLQYECHPRRCREPNAPACIWKEEIEIVIPSGRRQGKHTGVPISVAVDKLGRPLPVDEHKLCCKSSFGKPQTCQTWTRCFA